MADEQIVTSIVAKADLSSLVSEVHRASASLQQLQRELLSSNRAIASSTKLANNLFRDTLTGSGQYSSHFVNLNSDVDKFGKNLDAGRLKLKNYFQTFREHTTTQKGMIRELAKEQVMLQNSILQPLGRNAQGLMQYNVMIPRGLDAIANSGKLARMEMQIMNRALSEGATSLVNWGKNTQWAGRQLTVGLTVPLTMFGAAAGKAFREADTELVRLTKVYGGLAATSSAELLKVRKDVSATAADIARSYGQAYKDTISLAADLAATGKTGNELLNSTRQTSRLAILGETSVQDAMKATLSIQNTFKQNTDELTKSIDFLNAVENQTSTTMGDLIVAIPKAGPVIHAMGGSVKDLALMLVAMKEGGIDATQGANALKSALASLINPTKVAVNMFKGFGIDLKGVVTKNAGNLTATILELQGALDKLNPLQKQQAIEKLFGKFQFARMNALFANLGKQGSQTLQVLDLMKASSQDLAKISARELAQVTESASGKYKRAIEGMKAELASAGEEFLPVFTKFINAASKILDFFTGLPAPIKKALTFLAGFTALVGPLIMLTGVLANFFGYITKGIVQLRAFFMKAAGWKMLTPEIIAAEKAALMVENAFYSDAAAAQVLHNALQKLVLDYQNLSVASAKNRVPVNPGVATVGGSQVVAAGRRVVDPTDPYVGDPNTRAMSHINPRDPNSPATIFGGVPGAIPVNRGISRTPQMYMGDRLPNVEGLTSIKG
ncbi:MAG: phage tail tape measure protein, partial [Methylophilaceae bacterium]